MHQVVGLVQFWVAYMDFLGVEELPRRTFDGLHRSELEGMHQAPKENRGETKACWR